MQVDQFYGCKGLGEKGEMLECFFDDGRFFSKRVKNEEIDFEKVDFD